MVLFYVYSGDKYNTHITRLPREMERGLRTALNLIYWKYIVSLLIPPPQNLPQVMGWFRKWIVHL